MHRPHATSEIIDDLFRDAMMAYLFILYQMILRWCWLNIDHTTASARAFEYNILHLLSGVPPVCMLSGVPLPSIAKCAVVQTS